LSKAKGRGRQIECLNQLKQIAWRRMPLPRTRRPFPFQASTNIGGTLEFVQAANKLNGDFYFAFRHFQALSNDLDQLGCWFVRRLANQRAHFPAVRNENVSYFVAISADYASLILCSRATETSSPATAVPALFSPGRRHDRTWSGKVTNSTEPALRRRPCGAEYQGGCSNFAEPAGKAPAWLPVPRPLRPRFVGAAALEPRHWRRTARPSASAPLAEAARRFTALQNFFQPSPPRSATPSATPPPAVPAIQSLPPRRHSHASDRRGHQRSATPAQMAKPSTNLVVADAGPWRHQRP